MKIVITATKNDLNAPFDLRFGRCAYFCLYDQEKDQVVFIENEYANAANAAGTKAAERLIELSVEKVISGDFGPKAKELLDRFNMQMIILPDNGQTVADILKNFKS